MGERGGELVATNEPPVVTEPLFDAMMVKNSQGDGGLSDSAGANESERSEVFRTANDLLDKLVTSKEDPWWWRRGFSDYSRCEYKVLDPPVVEIANLV